MGTAAVASGFSIAASFLSSLISDYSNIVGSVKDLIKNIKTDDTLDIIPALIGPAPLLSKSIKATKIISKSISYASSGASNVFEPGATEVLGLASALISVGIDSYKVNEIRNHLSEIRNNSILISEKIQEIYLYINSQRKNEWVVVNETKLNKKYDEGGIGGRNLHFQNLLTNEILSISEMLNKPKSWLDLYNLEKVHSKTRGWYIRKKPNSIKEDNLG
ncbi:hypothetical protein [Mycoplasma buteonis]|uniref:hypothetical protein n=1 Tax=Mycoplasma buteonis TaxID=171280 RepID=UPI00055B8414|nr:hypothetical protein [Mycoplasma buteonis]